MSQKLTAKQLKAIHLLAQGMTTVEVARKLKLRRETLSRWKRLPQFQQQFDKVMEDLRDSLRYRLTQLVDTSITAVASGLDNFYSDPKRIQTALNVLRLLGNDVVASPKPAENEPNASRP